MKFQWNTTFFIYVLAYHKAKTECVYMPNRLRRLMRWPSWLTFMLINMVGEYGRLDLHTDIWVGRLYSISHSLCTWFRCALFCHRYIIRSNWDHLYVFRWTGSAVHVYWRFMICARDEILKNTSKIYSTKPQPNTNKGKPRSCSMWLIACQNLIYLLCSGG